ncbi:hypothetical protein BN946_scf185001.g34 [Trametes cinnabarina]|uniref:Tse2 ADP-ribosyltransferase toxin domain-containing protein n=1 Tax=Pycnoporus cinnabarinus TaxID=5643 RepID=A0A060SKU6_PYCCI|nr:hypothetical protein BN946_scf185001.g34 [Trametes cinnabarina]
MLTSLPRATRRALFPSLLRQYATSPSPRPLLGRFDHIDLARVQSGTNVRLRDYEQQKALKRFSVDLKLKDGLVHPAEGDHFIGPNGCSLRPPLSPMFQEVVRNFRGSNIIVYVLPEDQYSLQCTKPVELDGKSPSVLSSLPTLTLRPLALNSELTEFINKYGRQLDKEQFDQEYLFTI